MSMTESEATKLHVGIIGSGRKYPRSVGEYMDSIEELEQYRTIGTVDDVAFYKKCYDEESYEYCGEYGTDSCGCKDRMEYLEKKIAEYEAIGTVSEFREAMFFKKYFMELYGEGLEVANWHLNGDLELLDNIIDEAVERGKQEESGEHDE